MFVSESRAGIGGGPGGGGRGGGGGGGGGGAGSALAAPGASAPHIPHSVVAGWFKKVQTSQAHSSSPADTFGGRSGADSGDTDTCVSGASPSPMSPVRGPVPRCFGLRCSASFGEAVLQVFPVGEDGMGRVGAMTISSKGLRPEDSPCGPDRAIGGAGLYGVCAVICESSAWSCAMRAAWASVAPAGGGTSADSSLSAFVSNGFDDVGGGASETFGEVAAAISASKGLRYATGGACGTGKPGLEGEFLPLLGMLGMPVTVMADGWDWLLPREEVGIRGSTNPCVGWAGEGGSSLETKLETRSISCHYTTHLKAGPHVITGGLIENCLGCLRGRESHIILGFVDVVVTFL